MNEIRDAFSEKLKKDIVCNGGSYFCFIVPTTWALPPFSKCCSFWIDAVQWSYLKLGVVRCRRKDLGKWLLPSSLESMLLICIGSYGPFLCSVSIGSWCRRSVLSSAGPWMKIKVSAGGLPWPLSRCLAQALLPVAELLALESVRWPLSWGQGETGCGRVTRQWETWYQLASEQNRESYICTDGNSNSQSHSETEKADFLWASSDFPSYKRPATPWGSLP